MKYLCSFVIGGAIFASAVAAFSWVEGNHAEHLAIQSQQPPQDSPPDNNPKPSEQAPPSPNPGHAKGERPKVSQKQKASGGHSTQQQQSNSGGTNSQQQQSGGHDNTQENNQNSPKIDQSNSPGSSATGGTTYNANDNSGSIINQGSTVLAPQIVNNFGPAPARLDCWQEGNRITVRAIGGSIDSPTIALLFDRDVDPATVKVSTSGMFQGNGQVNNADGTVNAKSVWVFRGSPSLSEDKPIIVTISSPVLPKLLEVRRGPSPPF